MKPICNSISARTRTAFHSADAHLVGNLQSVEVGSQSDVSLLLSVRSKLVSADLVQMKYQK